MQTLLLPAAYYHYYDPNMVSQKLDIRAKENVSKSSRINKHSFIKKKERVMAVLQRMDLLNPETAQKGLAQGLGYVWCRKVSG